MKIGHHDNDDKNGDEDNYVDADNDNDDTDLPSFDNENEWTFPQGCNSLHLPLPLVNQRNCV